MITPRRSAEHGETRVDWLVSRHTFSFGEYYDPDHMGFRMLRVINEDRVAPNRGFGTHSHRDMEIISYVVSGALEHKDSLGTGSTIPPGEIQRMTAGSGVSHSEKNASPSEPVHFLQIWIVPETPGLPPSYEQRAFDNTALRGQLRCVGSRDGRDGSVTIHQDVSFYLSRLDAGQGVHHVLDPGRAAWVQVVRGRVDLDGTSLSAGDGAAVEDEKNLQLVATEPAEVLVFDLA